MYREILFRGKRKDNGEWVEGFLSPIWGSLQICKKHRNKRCNVGKA